MPNISDRIGSENVIKVLSRSSSSPILVSSGISTRGSAYFDTNGKLTSTNSPEVGTASTSNLILTTNASNVPVWTDTLDGGTF